jgi:probable HAF family extracellular repeat protein
VSTALVSLSLCGQSVKADTPSFISLTNVGTLSTDATESSRTSEGNSINNAGQVVGHSQVDPFSSFVQRGFLYTLGTLTDVGTLGAKSAMAYAINDVGQVVGTTGVASGESRAFIYSDGIMTDLGSLGGHQTTALGVNNMGQVVGSHFFRTSDGTTYVHPFLYSNGTIADMGTFIGLDDSLFCDINDSGQIAGYAVGKINGVSTQRAFLYEDGVATPLSTLGGIQSLAIAINKWGQAVGQSSPANERGIRACVWTNGAITDLGTLGGAESMARDINNYGHVVGLSHTDGFYGTQHAFLYVGGQMIDLNKLVPAGSGWELTAATGINDKGQISGYGTYYIPPVYPNYYGRNVTRPFLMTLNFAPEARLDTATVNEDSGQTPINVLGNDVDLNGDILTVTGVTDSLHGTARITSNGVTYEPDPEYSGKDTFFYVVSDASGKTTTASVSVTVKPVNDAPVAYGDSLQTDEDTALNIPLNGEDIDSNSLSHSIVSSPQHGTLSGNGAQGLKYTPNANYHGGDSFTFKAYDGQAYSTNTATVTITVNPVNDAPVARAGADQNLVYGIWPSSVRLDGSASTDADGDLLTYKWRNADALLGTDVTLTTLLPPGTHNIELTVTDSAGEYSSDTVTVTVDLPPNIVGATVKGAGTLGSAAGKVSTDFSGTSSNKGFKGNVIYSDSRTGFKFQSTRIFLVNVDGKTGRIYGVGKVNGKGAFNFVLTVVDNSPATSKSGDTVTFEVTNGYNFSSTMSKGDVRVLNGS